MNGAKIGRIALLLVLLGGGAIAFRAFDAARDRAAGQRLGDAGPLDDSALALEREREESVFWSTVPEPVTPAARYDSAALERALSRAEQLRPLTSLLISHGGELIVENYYNGMRADRTVNLKSISKTLLSPLVGIALRDSLLAGVGQPLHELLPEYFDEVDDPRKRRILLSHVLSMRTGLETTSFGTYGTWISSRDWVRFALEQPFVCNPGRCFEYSTGNSHMVSVILTRASGMSTLAFARQNLFGPLGISLSGWDRDPQGYLLGGNNMSLTPRDLLKFGELYLNRGVDQGRQLVPEEWIEAAWGDYAISPWNGHHYGYLWWSDRWGGERAFFAWGYGGQYLVVVPRLSLVAVVTSSLNQRRGFGHTRALRSFFDHYLVPAFRPSTADLTTAD